MHHINFTILIGLLFIVVGCGKGDEKNKCMTLEQVTILCIAEGIQIRPQPNQLWTVELDCERKYRVQQCYSKQKKYFPLDY